MSGVAADPVYYRCATPRPSVWCRDLSEADSCQNPDDMIVLIESSRVVRERRSWRAIAT